MWSCRLPTPEDNHKELEAFDFTKLSAVNTCPMWGILRYGHHKVFNASYRSMALEAGEACHQVFAALRCLDLFEYGGKAYNDVDFRSIALNRLATNLGSGRSEEGSRIVTDAEDVRTRAVRLACYVLETSGFIDDPSDKRRTLDKLMEACIAYTDFYEWGKSVPYINGDFVGIEVPFDLIVMYDYRNPDGSTGVRRCRFTGRVDGIHCYRNDRHHPYVEENKTASRLGSAWETSFEMSHQVTGYVVAASAIVQQTLDMARIRGLLIPQPRAMSEGVATVPVFRKEHHIQEWAAWFAHSAETFFRWKDEPALAPKYTHSCNRYFRSCSYIPLCASPMEERLEYIEQMETQEWSPLHEKAGD